MHLSQCWWHWISSGFAPALFTAHPLLCPTTLRSPPGSCVDPPQDPLGSFYCTAQHSTLGHPKNRHFPQFSGLAHAGAWPPWALTRRLSGGWGEIGENGEKRGAHLLPPSHPTRFGLLLLSSFPQLATGLKKMLLVCTTHVMPFKSCVGYFCLLVDFFFFF